MSEITLVLLPGMDGTGELFEPFIAALGDGVRVNTARYPVAEPLGYAELEAVARAAIPEQGPFVLLGESFSGPVAVRLAASASGRLKGLVLCCSFVRNPRPVLAVARPVVGVLPVGLAPVGLMSRFVLGRFGTKELAAAIGGAVSRVSPAALRARMRAVLGVDVSAELARVNAPILYLRASDDRVVPRAASELVSRLVPSVRVVEIAGPHFLLQASAGEAARVVGAFLGEVGDD